MAGTVKSIRSQTLSLSQLSTLNRFFDKLLLSTIFVHLQNIDLFSLSFCHVFRYFALQTPNARDLFLKQSLSLSFLRNPLLLVHSCFLCFFSLLPLPSPSFPHDSLSFFDFDSGH